MPAKWAFLPDALQPEVLFHRFPISFSYERFLFPRRRATTKVYIFFYHIPKIDKVLEGALKSRADLVFFGAASNRSGGLPGWNNW